MRPRKTNRHLPACMYHKNGAYYLVQKGKWTRLDADYQAALLAYARTVGRKAQGGMPALIDKALPHHIETNKLSVNTVKQYSVVAERLKDIFAEFNPEDVLPRHVAAIKMDMSETKNMFNRLLSLLRVIFSYALEWQMVDANPCAGVKPYKENKRERYVTDAEFAAILSVCSPYIRSILEMAYLTGQRISDVLAIHLSDISDEGIAFTQKKTKSKLIVQMTPDLEQVIAQAKALPRKVRTMTLFCSRSGKPVSYETVKDAFALARERAKVDDVTIHDLRAKSLTDADKEGKNAQALGGHASPAMTARYLRGRLPKLAQAPTMPIKAH